MSMVKYLFILLVAVPVLSTAQMVEEVTVFNCVNSSVTSSLAWTKNKKHDALHYDGTSRTVISRESIDRAKRTRMFLNHLDTLCSVNHASEARHYMNLLKMQLNVTPQLIGSVYFPNGSARSHQQDFGGMRSAIEQYSGEEDMLLVVGSADATGEDSFNHWLSFNRAQYLTNKVVTKNIRTFIIPLGKQGEATRGQEGNPGLRRADVYLLKPGA